MPSLKSSYLILSLVVPHFFLDIRVKKSTCNGENAPTFRLSPPFVTGCLLCESEMNGRGIIEDRRAYA